MRPEDMAGYIAAMALELDDYTEQLKGWRLSSDRLIMLDSDIQKLQRSLDQFRTMAKARHRHHEHEGE